MDAVKQENIEQQKSYTKRIPDIRVLVYGKKWAELLEQHTYGVGPNVTPEFLIFPMHKPNFCLTEPVFREVAPKDATRDLYPILQNRSNQASVLITKLSFYTSIASVVLVDTDFLDTAIGQEILRNAKDNNIPAYAVGVSTPSSLIAPFYVKAIQYPQTVEEMRDLILATYYSKNREK